MQIDITEEEREFLERICKRVQQSTSLFRAHSVELQFNNDMNAITTLIAKLSSLDANLINKVIKDDY